MAGQVYDLLPGLPPKVACYYCGKESDPERWGWNQDHCFPEHGFFVRHTDMKVHFFCPETQCPPRVRAAKARAHVEHKEDVEDF